MFRDEKKKLEARRCGNGNMNRVEVPLQMLTQRVVEPKAMLRVSKNLREWSKSHAYRAAS